MNMGDEELLSAIRAANAGVKSGAYDALLTKFIGPYFYLCTLVLAFALVTGDYLYGLTPFVVGGSFALFGVMGATLILEATIIIKELQIQARTQLGRLDYWTAKQAASFPMKPAGDNPWNRVEELLPASERPASTMSEALNMLELVG
jgi:hypothetical protein